MIVAIAEKTRAIGLGNELLFRISDDLKRFKQLTTGHTIIMGRKTYESIGRPLPNRTNIVITRNLDFKPEGIVVAHSLEEALNEANKIEKEEIFIIGGGEIYNQAISQADRLYLTIIHENKEGNVFFPEYEKVFTKIISIDDHNAEITPYTFVVLER